MALPQIISRNPVQKIPDFEINGTETTQPNTWYTCPTGKKAIIKGVVSCSSRGAAATASFEVATIAMFTWSKSTGAVAGVDYINAPLTLSDAAGGQRGVFDIEIAAGETLITTQASDTDAVFTLFAKVQETSA